MKKENNSKSLNGKDLMNVGIFTALFSVLGVTTAITLGLVPIGFMLLAFVAPLVTGIPMMLYIFMQCIQKLHIMQYKVLTMIIKKYILC